MRSGRGFAVLLLTCASVLAQAPPEEPPVASSPEAAELARVTCEKLNALHYAIPGSGAPGFTAAYEVCVEGRAIARLRLAYSSERAELTSAVEGTLPERMREALRDMGRQGAWVAVCHRHSAVAVDVERRDGQIVADLTARDQVRDPGITRSLIFLPEDLLSWRRVEWHADGDYGEDTARFEGFEGKTCLVAYRDFVRQMDGVTSEISYTFRWALRDGRPFPDLMSVEVAQGETRQKFEFALETVAFVDPDAPLPPPVADDAPVPASEEAAALAAATFVKVAATHFRYAVGDPPGFTATFAATRDGASVGTARVDWDGTAAGIDVALTTLSEVADRVRIEAQFALVVQQALFMPWLTENVHAAERDGRVVVDLTAPGKAFEPGVEKFLCDFSPDVLSWRSREWFSGGKYEETRADYEAAGEVAYLVKLARKYTMEDGAACEDSIEIRYCHRGDRVFLKRVAMDLSVAGRKTKWEFRLNEVSFGAAPASEEARLATEIVEKADAVHYNLFAAGAKGFEAYYSVTWQRYSVGRVRFRWVTEPRTVETVHEGNVSVQVADEFYDAGDMTFKEWITLCAAQWMWEAVQFRFFPDDRHTMRAAKTPEGEVVLIHDAKDHDCEIEQRIVTFTGDGLARSMEDRLKSGRAAVYEYEQQAFEGRQMRKRSKHTIREPDKSVWVRTVAFVYRRVDGVLVPSSIDVHTDSPTPAFPGSDTVLTLEEVKIIR